MAGLHKSDFTNPVINWIDTRLPIFTTDPEGVRDFPTPKNFNYFWNFGALAMVTLMIMIVTGIFLAMNYTPHAIDGLRQRPAHHARRELRLADPLRPRQRRLDVLRR
jgi:quinol-cytochrome oxidoreductase complex cytochrome b subunit